ncbi:MAG: hypothetical protein ACYTE3_20720 [Planctomycetota bacterium]|jgi:hypothetical protein
MKKETNQYTLITVLSATFFLVGGCWQFTLEPVQAPYVTRKPPYVAILQFPYKQNERVLEVMVREEVGAKYDHNYNLETCWHIEAVAPVSAKDFSVKIGDVPQSFRQLVPQDGQSFLPVAGGKYVIRIKTTNSHASYCGWWTPRTD